MDYNLLYRFIESKIQQCSKRKEPEIMSLQSLAGVMNDAVFPEPEECCLLKNFPSACPPVIRSFGAYAFGGVSKTLHLTESVFRERVRSLGDTEILSPENKYIENNYESMLDMQIAENSFHGPLNLRTKFDKPGLEDLPVSVPVVPKTSRSKSPPRSPAVFTEPAEAEHQTPPIVNNIDLTADVTDDEDNDDDTPLKSSQIEIEATSEFPKEQPPRNVFRKSTAMPRSVKVIRQVLPDDATIIKQNSSVNPIMDFRRILYVNVARLTELQIRRASRKRTLSRMETTGTLALESSKKSEDTEIPVKRRVQSKDQAIMQMLSRSASLDDDYNDEECSNSTEKSESHVDFPAENEPSSPPEPKINSRNKLSRKTSLMEFDIFEVPCPKKKTPSNHREKYNRPIFQREQDKRLVNSSHAHNSSSSRNGSRHSGTTRDKNSQQTKTSKKKYDKKCNASRKSSNETKSSKISKSQTKVTQHAKKDITNSTKAQSGASISKSKYLTEAKKEIDFENLKLRNQLDKMHSLETRCWDIGEDIEPTLRKFKIPKKNYNARQSGRQNVRFFDDTEIAHSNSGLRKKNRINNPKEDYRREQDWSDTNKYSRVQKTKKSKKLKPETSLDISKQNSKVKKSQRVTATTSEHVDNHNITTESSSSNHSIEQNLQAVVGEADDSNRSLEVVHYKLRDQEFIEGAEQKNIVTFGGVGPWEPTRVANPENLEVLEGECSAEGGNFYYTLGPGPTNESNQVVQVQVAEEDHSFFAMDPRDHAIECIGEVEVYTSLEENHTSVITILEPEQTQSGEITTTTVCDQRVHKVPNFSDEDSRTPPPPTRPRIQNPTNNKCDSDKKLLSSKKNWSEDGPNLSSESECSSSSCSSCSSSSSSSDFDTE